MATQPDAQAPTSKSQVPPIEIAMARAVLRTLVLSTAALAGMYAERSGIPAYHAIGLSAIVAVVFSFWQAYAGKKQT